MIGYQAGDCCDVEVVAKCRAQKHSYLFLNSYLGEEHHVELVRTVAVAGDGRLHKLPVAKINSLFGEKSGGSNL